MTCRNKRGERQRSAYLTKYRLLREEIIYISKTNPRGGICPEGYADVADSR
jgi:hypothetical protein